jgi:hypothetical protein
VLSADRTTFTGSHMSRTQIWPADPIAVSAAARPASETKSAGSQEAIPTAPGSGQMPGVSGMDSDAWMRSLFKSQRWFGRDRSCPHEHLGSPGIGTEDYGLLGDPPVCGSSPGESGFVPSLGRERIFVRTWELPERARAGIAESILDVPAGGVVEDRGACRWSTSPRRRGSGYWLLESMRRVTRSAEQH